MLSLGLLGTIAAGSGPPRWRVSPSTIIILALTAVAAIAYSLGGIPLQQATNTSGHPPHTVGILIPDGVGSNPRLNFEPATTTVVIGVNNTIVWTDQDNSSRNTVSYVSVPPGALQFDSGPLTYGRTFTVTLTVPGTYSYQCIFHPGWMFGKVVVKAQGSPLPRG